MRTNRRNVSWIAAVTIVWLAATVAVAQSDPRAGDESTGENESKAAIVWRGVIFADWEGTKNWTVVKQIRVPSGEPHGATVSSRVQSKMLQELEIEEELLANPNTSGRSILRVVSGEFGVATWLDHSHLKVSPNPLYVGGHFLESRLRKHPDRDNSGGVTFLEEMPDADSAPSDVRICYYLPSVTMTTYGEPQLPEPPASPEAGRHNVFQIVKTPTGQFETPIDWTMETTIGIPPGTGIGDYSSWIKLICFDDRKRYVDTKRGVMRGQFTRSEKANVLIGKGGVVLPRAAAWNTFYNDPHIVKEWPRIPKQYDREQSRFTARWYFERERQPIQLELTSCPEDWIPDITGPNSKVRFRARIVKPEGLKAKWKCVLFDTSRQVGVCCNAFQFPSLRREWNKNGQQYDDVLHPDLIFDYRKYDSSGDMTAVPTDRWNVLKTTQETSEIEFDVNCMDYGAYGKLTLAVFVDGSWRWLKAGEVQGSDEKFARIPRDDHAPYEGPYIAPAAICDVTDIPYAGMDPTADLDGQPVGRPGTPGDGLTVYEEYRGFVARAFSKSVTDKPIYLKLDPTHKDLFVRVDSKDRDLAEFLFEFEHVSELNVHTVTPQANHYSRRFIGQDRVINFNSDKNHRNVRQHALWMVGSDAINRDQKTGLILLGVSKGDFGPKGTRGVGPPKNVRQVVIFKKAMAERWGKHLKDGDFDPAAEAKYQARTVVHELGHAVGIEHHGFINDGDNAIAKPGGQNSGDAKCAMRYTHWPKYLDPVTNKVKKRDFKDVIGLSFCTSPTGTGPNADGAYCGDATLGNCLGQIVISDVYDSQPDPDKSAAPTEHAASSDSVSEESQRGEEQVDPAEEEIQQAESESGIRFDLDRALTSRKLIVPGEAVVLSLDISAAYIPSEGWTADANDSEKDAPMTLGTNTTPWFEEVQFLARQQDGEWIPIAVEVKPIGEVTHTVLKTRTEKLPTHWEVVTDESPKITPSQGTTFEANFVIDVDQTAKLSPGELRVYAAFPKSPAAEKPAWEVLSHGIELTIADPSSLPPEDQGKLESQKRLSQANVAYIAAEYEESARLAQTVLSEFPNSLDARLVLARSLEQTGKLGQALNEYYLLLRQYSQQNPDAREPPHSILWDIDRIEQALFERKP